MNERQWVDTLVEPLQTTLNRDRPSPAIGVVAGRHLRYTSQIHAYQGDDPAESDAQRYETDLLFFDTLPDDRWVPRVIVECKLKSINTHEALAYSSKASTHKQVHPYLRYGMLIGQRRHAGIPRRLIKHGTHFDFLVAWIGRPTAGPPFRRFCQLIGEEIEASRTLQCLLTTRRSRLDGQYQTLHRPLKLNRA